ncbi:MAG: hypothetical protein A2Z28_04020 [Chloroflexi bacterium RBG_16_51_9]|nr:MAG: hypothetical protein A2Z28_04020 [Chloroflexi bacterium RBG_16_51_9]
MEENIFSSLIKWGDAKSQEENYYSKSLTLVLSHLLKDERCKFAAVNILNETFAKRLGFSFSTNEKIDIQSHKTNDNKRPDITIEAEDKLIYVEIKVSSPVNEEARERIRNYIKRLSDPKQKRTKNGVMLVTKFGDARVDSIILPKQQISWFTLSGVLRKALEELKRNEDTQSATVYLLKKFHEFLKEKNMSVERVDGTIDYLAMRDIYNLLTIVQRACKELKFTNLTLDTGEDIDYGQFWVGYKCKREKQVHRIGFWVSTVKEPIHLCLEIEDEMVKRFDEDELQDNLGAEKWDDKTIAIYLDLDSKGFFTAETDAGKQVQIVKEFVQETLKKWSVTKRPIKKTRRL